MRALTEFYLLGALILMGSRERWPASSARAFDLT